MEGENLHETIKKNVKLYVCFDASTWHDNNLICIKLLSKKRSLY